MSNIWLIEYDFQSLSCSEEWSNSGLFTLSLSLSLDGGDALHQEFAAALDLNGFSLADVILHELPIGIAGLIDGKHYS